MAVISKTGLVRMLSAVVSKELYVKLYTNNKNISTETSAKDLVEARGGGYKPIVMRKGDWKVIVENGAVQAKRREVTWKFTSRVGKVFGYYVTDYDGTLIWGTKFKTPFEAEREGDTIKVNPTLVMER